MKIAAIANDYPAFDRASAPLRFFNVLTILSAKHQIYYSAVNWRDQVSSIGEEAVRRYRGALQGLGIEVSDDAVHRVLRKDRYDAILFEFYYTALPVLEETRFWQPAARIVIDTGDVNYHRLLRKAALTHKKEDAVKAQRTKLAELGTYRASDLVVAVSEEDKAVLWQETHDIRVEIIPNLHVVPEFDSATQTIPNSLIFIGSFDHEPNRDAIVYFSNDILPLIREKVPSVTLRVIGNSPPPEIQRLAGPGVEILGQVPDTTPFLRSSRVSIAPLRFGAGLKGKVGEAMACSVPVVTTLVGIEGFGLSPGVNVLVGDAPQEFADAVVRLCTDDELYQLVRKSGWWFLKSKFSTEVVAKRIEDIFDSLPNMPIKALPANRRVQKNVKYFLDRHVTWRLKSRLDKTAHKARNA